MKIIKAGKIVKVHGIKGEVKLLSYTSPSNNIFSYKLYDNENNLIEFSQVRNIKGEEFVCKVSGIIDRNEAEDIIGKELFIKREDFKPSLPAEYYIADLTGLEVKLNDKIIGHIENVLNYGAGDLIEVYFKSNQEIVMFPFTDEIFPEVNITERYVTFIPKKII